MGKTSQELKLVNREIKSLTRKYKKAEGADREKLMDKINQKQTLKKELEALENKE